MQMRGRFKAAAGRPLFGDASQHLASAVADIRTRNIGIVAANLTRSRISRPSGFRAARCRTIAGDFSKAICAAATLWVAVSLVLGLPVAKVAEAAQPRRAAGVRAPSAASASVLLPAQGDAVRHAIIVGNNRGEKPARALRYAEREVETLATLLERRGDFQHIELLQGDQAAQLDEALNRAHRALGRARAKGQKTFFLFYYSGHGDKEALEMGATRYRLRDLRQELETIPADIRLGFVDACQSGALTGVKGGRRAPGYSVRLADPGGVHGMAIVTSSTANELSQESDDLRGSFFSHNIMSGLRGAADASGDGLVTLSELYHYAFRRTLANTATSLVGGQHPTYETRMSGAGDVVLTRTQASDARLTLPQEPGATYTIFREEHVAAEVAASASHAMALALPAGPYRVVRRAAGAITETQVTLVPGRATTVSPGAMVALRLVDNPRKKISDDFADSERGSQSDFGIVASTRDGGATGEAARLGSGLPRNALAVHAGAITSVFEGTDSIQPAFGLSYTRGLSWGALRARVGVAQVDGVDQELQSRYVSIEPALDLLFSLLSTERFAIVAGPSASMPYVRQDLGGNFVESAARATSTTVGFAYGATGAFVVRLAGNFQLWLEGGFGASLLKANRADQGISSSLANGTESRVDHQTRAQMSLGGAVGF